MQGAGPNNPLSGHPASRLPTVADAHAVGSVPAQISARADIGHVNLTVSDLDRAVVFYRDVIGLRVTQSDDDSAFLAAGDYHHHVALNRWDREAKPARARTTGLHHFALRLPDVSALAEVIVRLLRAGHELLGATDHGVNLAVYLTDPDGNGLELMVDRPAAEWPRNSDGSIAMTVAPFDVQGLLGDTLPLHAAPPETDLQP
jgi:catechol 2,3-dioxygenase